MSEESITDEPEGVLEATVALGRNGRGRVEAEKASGTDGAGEALRTEEAEEALRTEEAEEALRTEEAEEALRTEEAEEALRTKEAGQALRTKEAEEALRTEEAGQALRTEEAGQALRTKDASTPVRPSLSPEDAERFARSYRPSWAPEEAASVGVHQSTATTTPELAPPAFPEAATSEDVSTEPGEPETAASKPTSETISAERLLPIDTERLSPEALQSSFTAAKRRIPFEPEWSFPVIAALLVLVVAATGVALAIAQAP